MRLELGSKKFAPYRPSPWIHDQFWFGTILYMKQVVRITVTELTAMAEKMYGNMVKGVVDIEKKILVLDAEMHVDEEQYLLEHGSRQRDLWGINLHPTKFGSNEFIEFDSMVNIRPSQNNRSRSVDNPEVRAIIQKIISDIVTK
jgi:Protein of unknown function (DUF5674)